MNQTRYLNVDELQAQTTLQEAGAKCNVTIDVHGTSRQLRLDCPFNCPGDHAGKREISVDSSNPQKVFTCHAYQCQTRGNLLTLMHGWLTGTKPTGGKLKGAEFNHVRSVLVGGPTPLPRPETENVVALNAQVPKTSSERNVPLVCSDNEKARELVTLDEKFLREVAYMQPSAASYVRRHPCLTPATMAKWRVGVLPQDGGSDKRGWSLRGQVIYPVLAEDGKLLAWVARDPQYEIKEELFDAMTPEGRAKAKRPAKHRFPVDFHRGLELFGQHAARLAEPGYKDLIATCGIIVVEGFNDVLALDSLGVPAVAIMSNKITDAQLIKINRFAMTLSGGKVTLLFDADDAGDEGARETLWRLAQRGLEARLGWSRAMHSGRFDGRQPESLTQQEWASVIYPSLTG